MSELFSATIAAMEADLDPANPLAKPWSLELGLPDFSVLKHEDFEPAIRAGMRQQRAQWEAIATNPQPPTVDNTVVACELSGALLERALIALGALTSATYCPDLDDLEERLAPELSEHSDAYSLDARMYRRYKQLAESDQEFDEETKRVITLAVEEFERDGVALEGAALAKLRELNAAITKLSARFHTLVTDEIHASGVANFTLTPQLATLESHDERVALLNKAKSRNFGGERDTRQIVEQLAKLRAQRAQLLGFEHHAASVAAESAAKTTQAVNAMLSRLAGPAMANARRDGQRLAQRMAQAEPGVEFTTADWLRYEEAERKELFGVDDEILAPYLELNNVIDGVFFAANRLYGITFHEREDLAAHMYDPDLRVWEVREADGSVLALFVGDYYARKGKSGGAWMNTFNEPGALTDTKPIIINCLNITKPASGPTLLSWDNVITCFHEFGHALHGMFGATYYPSVNGTNVARDVVEFPSQVNENWALHPQVLARYARHHVTGEPMPANLLEQLRAQGSFGQGYMTSEYLGAALLDQAWHQLAPEQVPTEAEQVEEFEHQALAQAGIDDALVLPRYRTAYFSHAFGGGYDAAYYAYIWSEVMDADAVAWFRTAGLGAIGTEADNDGGLNRQAGQRFRDEFLSRGDSREAALSYQRFAGRKPSLEHLLKRRGLD